MTNSQAPVPQFSFEKMILTMMPITPEALAAIKEKFSLPSLEPQEHLYTFFREFFQMGHEVEARGAAQVWNKRLKNLPERVSHFYYRKHEEESWVRSDNLRLLYTQEFVARHAGILIIHADKNRMTMLYNMGHHLLS